MIVAFLILAWFVCGCFYIDWDIREQILEAAERPVVTPEGEPHS